MFKLRIVFNLDGENLKTEIVFATKVFEFFFNLIDSLTNVPFNSIEVGVPVTAVEYGSWGVVIRERRTKISVEISFDIPSSGIGSTVVCRESSVA